MTNHPKEETMHECVQDFVVETFNHEWDEWVDSDGPEVLDVRYFESTVLPGARMVDVELNNGYSYRITIIESNNPHNPHKKGN